MIVILPLAVSRFSLHIETDKSGIMIVLLLLAVSLWDPKRIFFRVAACTCQEEAG
jgi:hypothetical protein